MQRHRCLLPLLAYLWLILFERVALTWIHVIRLMNALAIRLKWVSQHLFTVDAVIAKIGLAYCALCTVYVYRLLFVCLVVVLLSWLLGRSSAWCGWTVVRVSVSKPILRHIVEIMLSLELYLLQLLLYLYILLIWRKVVSLLLRGMTVVVRIARYWLVDAALKVLIWVRVLSAKEPSLSHSFVLRVNDACLLLGWWALWLGEVNYSLLHGLVRDWSRCTWVVDVSRIFVLHLIRQSLFELHLLLHFMLLVRKYRMFALGIIADYWHLLLLLHLSGVVWLNDCSYELAIRIAYLVLGRWALYWVGHWSWVMCCEELLLSIIETTAKIHQLSFPLKNLLIHRWIVMTLRALLEFHLVVLIRVVIDSYWLSVYVILADATAASLDRFLAHDVLMKRWGSNGRVMLIHDLLRYLTVIKILRLLCRL